MSINLEKTEDQSVFENISKTVGIQFISDQKTSTGSYILNFGQMILIKDKKCYHP